MKLPLTVSSEDFSYKSLTHPNLDLNSQKRQLEEDAKDLRGRIRDMLPTTFAVSFVVSFQNRWTSFKDPDRLMNRFPDDFNDMAIFYAATRQQQELQREHSPNYWHLSDYMQHRLIGPVVLQVYESEVLQPGIYSAVPKVTHWEAPEFIMSDAFLEDIDTRFTARLKERIATADEAGNTRASLMYAASLEKGWWDTIGKNLVLPQNRPKYINYPPTRTHRSLQPSGRKRRLLTSPSPHVQPGLVATPAPEPAAGSGKEPRIAAEVDDGSRQLLQGKVPGTPAAEIPRPGPRRRPKGDGRKVAGMEPAAPGRPGQG